MGELAALLPSGPCLLVSDEQLVGLDLIDECRGALADRGIEMVLFDSVEADPSRETLLAAVEAGRSGGVESVIGFGGGSPMDVAKLAAYLLGSRDELDDIWGQERATGRKLPLALVPTTAGTGSEATQYSVITCADGVKQSVNARALTADWALLDATLTLGLPRSVTSATGIDAIVHAVEAYTSAKLKNPVSDMLAREALRLLAANLVTACEQPSNLDARSGMLLGAYLAGLAFANAPVGGIHALAYPLGGLHHLPHGLSNALMMPHVLRHNLHAAREQYAELAEVIEPTAAGLGSQARAGLLVERLEGLVLACGLAPRLRDHGIGERDVARLACDAMLGERMLVHNPCPISQQDALRLYEAAW
jgi:alcohol dehydrogenase